MWQQANSHWGYEDPVYRFYHQSFKVYHLQSDTAAIVKALQDLAPHLPLNPWFTQIVGEGTAEQFSMVDPFTANVVSPTRLYLARKLTFGDHAQEGTEQIRCLKMPLTEAVQKIMTSEITHGPSCVLILKTALLLG